MTKLKKNDEVIARHENDEWVLFNPQTSAVHIVSYVGHEIYSLCDGLSKENVYTQVIQKLQIEDTSENKAYIYEFIENLIKRKVISEV